MSGPPATGQPMVSVVALAFPTMAEENHNAPEKNYGVIYDTVSWDLAIDPSRTAQVAGCQTFQAGPDTTPGGPHALARTDALALYARTFADGGGENGLHSHPDDAVWLVVSGHAAFYAEAGELLGSLETSDGLLVPAGTSYRFVCQGVTTLVRVAARPVAG
jgi:mannose-6-phosphate isomerase-like protein (cupin superfamily)